MLASGQARLCEFCDTPVAVEDYPRHLQYHHKMNCQDNKIVKCMFCLEPMSEVDMFSHVFYGHNISGLFFSTAGSGDEREKVTTNTVSIQTDSPELDQNQELHLDHTGESYNNNNNNNEMVNDNSDDAEVVERFAQEEENLILIDDESDFEIESDPVPDLFPPSQEENEPAVFDSHKDEVTLLKVIDIMEVSEDTPEPEVTLINIAKTPAERVKKKVTFSDVTNYFPIKKRTRTRLKVKEREPLILGANTTLKYLKYWGTTNKPDQ